MTRRAHRTIKIIAAVLVAALAAQDLAFAAPSPPDLNGWSLRGSRQKNQYPKIGFKVPDAAGFIEDGYRAPAGSNKWIVLLQDAHANPSAQLNSARILGEIARSKNARLVFTEAAQGDVTLSDHLAANADHASVLVSAGSLLRKGRLSGFELADLQAPGSFVLWGVEDEKLYAEALELYRAEAASRERALLFLDRARRTAETLADELLGSELRDLWSLRARHEAGDASTVDYVLKLTTAGSVRGLRLSDYPHLALLKELVRAEQGMDRQQISDEAAAVLASLDDKARVEIGSLDPAAGPAAQSAYWASVVERGGVVRRDSQLRRFIDYLVRCRELDALAVTEEIEGLERAVYEVLASTDDARQLVIALRNLAILKDIIELKASPSAFDRYRSSRSADEIIRTVAFLNARIHALGRHYDQAVFLDDRYAAAEKTAIEFYELSARRDAAMIASLAERMSVLREDHAVLVAGGYHAPGLKRELRARGISYVSVIPAATQPTDTALYEKILLAQTVSAVPVHKAALTAAVPASNLMIRPLAAAARLGDPRADAALRELGVDLDHSSASQAAPTAVERRSGARMSALEERAEQLQDQTRLTRIMAPWSYGLVLAGGHVLSRICDEVMGYPTFGWWSGFGIITTATILFAVFVGRYWVPREILLRDYRIAMRDVKTPGYLRALNQIFDHSVHWIDRAIAQETIDQLIGREEAVRENSQAQRMDLGAFQDLVRTRIGTAFEVRAYRKTDPRTFEASLMVPSYKNRDLIHLVRRIYVMQVDLDRMFRTAHEIDLIPESGPARGPRPITIRVTAASSGQGSILRPLAGLVPDRTAPRVQFRTMKILINVMLLTAGLIVVTGVWRIFNDLNRRIESGASDHGESADVLTAEEITKSVVVAGKLRRERQTRVDELDRIIRESGPAEMVVRIRNFVLGITDGLKIDPADMDPSLEATGADKAVFFFGVKAGEFKSGPNGGYHNYLKQDPSAAEKIVDGLIISIERRAGLPSAPIQKKPTEEKKQQPQPKRGPTRQVDVDPSKIATAGATYRAIGSTGARLATDPLKRMMRGALWTGVMLAGAYWTAVTIGVFTAIFSASAVLATFGVARWRRGAKVASAVLLAASLTLLLSPLDARVGELADFIDLVHADAKADRALMDRYLGILAQNELSYEDFGAPLFGNEHRAAALAVRLFVVEAESRHTAGRQRHGDALFPESIEPNAMRTVLVRMFREDEGGEVAIDLLRRLKDAGRIDQDYIDGLSGLEERIRAERAEGRPDAAIDAELERRAATDDGFRHLMFHLNLYYEMDIKKLSFPDPLNAADLIRFYRKTWRPGKSIQSRLMTTAWKLRPIMRSSAEINADLEKTAREFGERYVFAENLDKVFRLMGRARNRAERGDWSGAWQSQVLAEWMIGRVEAEMRGQVPAGRRAAFDSRIEQARKTLAADRAAYLTRRVPIDWGVFALVPKIGGARMAEKARSGSDPTDGWVADVDSAIHARPDILRSVSEIEDVRGGIARVADVAIAVREAGAEPVERELARTVLRLMGEDDPWNERPGIQASMFVAGLASKLEEVAVGNDVGDRSSWMYWAPGSGMRGYAEWYVREGQDPTDKRIMLRNLVVDRHQRGRGIGTELFLTVLADAAFAARRQGIKYVDWIPQNSHAEALWTKAILRSGWTAEEIGRARPDAGSDSKTWSVLASDVIEKLGADRIAGARMTEYRYFVNDPTARPVAAKGELRIYDAKALLPTGLGADQQLEGALARIRHDSYRLVKWSAIAVDDKSGRPLPYATGYLGRALGTLRSAEAEETLLYLAVNAQNEVIGYAALKPEPAARTAALEALYVAPESKHTGAGRALLDLVIDQARSREARTLHWSSSPTGYLFYIHYLANRMPYRVRGSSFFAMIMPEASGANLTGHYPHIAAAQRAFRDRIMAGARSEISSINGRLKVGDLVRLERPVEPSLLGTVQKDAENTGLYVLWDQAPTNAQTDALGDQVFKGDLKLYAKSDGEKAWRLIAASGRMEEFNADAHLLPGQAKFFGARLSEVSMDVRVQSSDGRGLHGRPSGALVALAIRVGSMIPTAIFELSVLDDQGRPVAADEQSDGSADLTSISEVMNLNVANGDRVRIKIQAELSKDVLEKVVRAFAPLIIDPTAYEVSQLADQIHQILADNEGSGSRMAGREAIHSELYLRGYSDRVRKGIRVLAIAAAMGGLVSLADLIGLGMGCWVVPHAQYLPNVMSGFSLLLATGYVVRSRIMKHSIRSNLGSVMTIMGIVAGTVFHAPALLFVRSTGRALSAMNRLKAASNGEGSLSIRKILTRPQFWSGTLLMAASLTAVVIWIAGSGFIWAHVPIILFGSAAFFDFFALKKMPFGSSNTLRAEEEIDSAIRRFDSDVYRYGRPDSEAAKLPQELYRIYDTTPNHHQLYHNEGQSLYDHVVAIWQSMIALRQGERPERISDGLYRFVLDQLRDPEMRLLLEQVILFHDIGKHGMGVRQKNGDWSFPRHPKLARAMLRRWKANRRLDGKDGQYLKSVYPYLEFVVTRHMDPVYKVHSAQGWDLDAYFGGRRTVDGLDHDRAARALLAFSVLDLLGSWGPDHQPSSLEPAEKLWEAYQAWGGHSGARMAEWKARDLSADESGRIREAFVRDPDQRGGRQEIYYLNDRSVAVLPRIQKRAEDLTDLLEMARYLLHFASFLNQIRILERINPAGERNDLPKIEGYDHAMIGRADALVRGLMDRMRSAVPGDFDQLKRAPALAMIQRLLDDNAIFFVESFVQGEALSTYLNEMRQPLGGVTPPTQDRLLDLVRQMAEIYIHLKSSSIRLHHLDIKPSNFMIRNGGEGGFEIAQVDFGDSVLDEDLENPSSLGRSILELSRRYGLMVASLRYMIQGEYAADTGTSADELRTHFTRRDLGAFLFTLFELFQLDRPRTDADHGPDQMTSAAGPAQGPAPKSDQWYEDSFARYSQLDLERIVQSSSLDVHVRLMLLTEIQRVFLPLAPSGSGDPSSPAFFHHQDDLGLGFFTQLKELVDALLERTPKEEALFTEPLPVPKLPIGGPTDPGANATTQAAQTDRPLPDPAAVETQTADVMIRRPKNAGREGSDQTSGARMAEKKIGSEAAWKTILEKYWPGEVIATERVIANHRSVLHLTGLTRRFVVIGDYLFVDAGEWDRRKEELKSLKSRIVVTHFSAYFNRPLMRGLAFMQAHRERFKGKIVFDAGSMSGAYATLALKLGAQRVHLAGYRGIYRDRAREEMLASGFRFDRRAEFVRDLSEIDPDLEVDVVMSHLPDNGQRTGLLGKSNWNDVLSDSLRPASFFALGFGDPLSSAADQFKDRFVRGGWRLRGELLDLNSSGAYENPGHLLFSHEQHEKILKGIRQPDFALDLGDSGLDPADADAIFYKTKLIEKTLLRIHGLRKKRADLERVGIRLYSEVGKMRQVFLVTVDFKDPSTPSKKFILKLTRASAEKDYDTMAHEMKNFYVNRRIKRHTGVLQYFGPEGSRRIAATGAWYEGVSFDRVRDDFEAQVAVVVEVLDTWKRTREAYLADLHQMQFVLMRKDDGWDARLIDKGHTKYRSDIKIRIGLAEEDGELIPISGDADLEHLSEWVDYADETQIVYTLLDDIAMAPPTAPLKTGEWVDPDDEMLGRVSAYQYRMDPRAVVEGARRVFGAEGAGFFFDRFFLSRERREDKWEIYEALRRAHPELMRDGLPYPATEMRPVRAEKVGDTWQAVIALPDDSSTYHSLTIQGAPSRTAGRAVIRIGSAVFFREKTGFFDVGDARHVHPSMEQALEDLGEQGPLRTQDHSFSVEVADDADLKGLVEYLSREAETRVTTQKNIWMLPMAGAYGEYLKWVSEVIRSHAAPKGARMAGAETSAGDRWVQKIEASPALRPLKSPDAVHIYPGKIIAAGGYATAVADPHQNDVWVKVAKTTSDPVFEGYSEHTFVEADVLARLAQAGVREGVPQVLAVGVNPGGAVWARLKGPVDARSWASDRFERLEPLQKIDRLIRLAEILADVHRAGFVHRDIKPENILLDPQGRIWLIDFGGAAPIGESMEHLRGRFGLSDRTVTPSLDMVGFGQMIRGLLLLPAKTRRAIVPISPAWESGLTALVDGMTQKHPSDRTPSSMDEVARALRSAREHLATTQFEAASPESETPDTSRTDVFPIFTNHAQVYRDETYYRLGAPEAADQILPYLEYVDRDVLIRVLTLAMDQAVEMSRYEKQARFTLEEQIQGDSVRIRIRTTKRPDLTSVAEVSDLSVIQNAVGSIYRNGIMPKDDRRAQVNWRNDPQKTDEYTFLLNIPLLTGPEIYGAMTAADPTEAVAVESGARMAGGLMPGPDWTLKPIDARPLTPRGVFGEEPIHGPVVMLSDNSGTLARDFRVPMDPKIGASIRRLLAIDDRYFIIQSGDPASALLKQYASVIEYLTQHNPAALTDRFFIVCDGGTTRVHFDATGQAVIERDPDWTVDHRRQIASQFIESFYEEWEKGQGVFLALNGPAAAELVARARLEAAAHLKTAWDGRERTERIVIPLIPKGPEFDAVRGLIGDAEVYDVGTKVTITLHADKLSESPQLNALMRTIYEAALKNRLWAESESERPDLVYGPGYVDASRRSKGSGVRALFDSRPTLQALKARPAGMPQDAVVKIVVGDSRNDLTTMNDEDLLPGSRNLNVFVNRLPEYAEALPETAVVALRDHVAGTIDLFGWLERAAPEHPNEEILVPFPAEKWLRVLERLPDDARVDRRAERLLAQNLSNRAPFELAEWFGRCIDDLHQRLGIDTYSSLLIVTRRIQEALIHREIAPGDLYRSFIRDGGLYVYVPRAQVEFEDLRASHHYWDVFNVPSEKIVARHLRLNRSMLLRQRGTPEIVVIAGAAGSGKTVFAGKLDTELRNEGGTAIRISIDDFLLPRNERRAKNLRGVDAFDRQRLDRVIDAVRTGGVTTLPKYVPEDGSIQETEPVDFSKYGTVILEGAFPLSFQSIRSAADLRVFIYENAQTQYDSRRARDPKERGYRPVDIAYSFAEVGAKETLPLVSRDIPVFDWIIHGSRDEGGSAGSGMTQPYRILWRSEPNDPTPAAADLRRDASPGARMADGPGEDLPVAEKYILNSRGETMKEAVARLREASRPDLTSGMDLDPMQWTFSPDHGGQAERERLSKLTQEALGEEIKSKIRSGVMANWSGLDLTRSGRDFLKSFIDMQSGSLESMEHHLFTSRAYDHWVGRDGAIKHFLALKPEKMADGEMYKALLQEIAARWALPEGRGESGEILFDFDARYEPDLELYMRARHGKKIEPLTASEARRDVASAVVMGAYALNYAAKVMESGGDVAAVTITPDPEAESGVVRATVTSSDWLQRHSLNNLAQHLSALTRPPDGFSRDGFGADALQNLREHLLSHNRQAERASDRYATYRELFDRAVKQLKSSHDALELLVDAEPQAAALDRYPKEMAEMGSDERLRQVELAVVPTQALGYYLLSKAFVGREDRLPSFRKALRLFLELEPIIVEELQKIAELPGLEVSLPQPSSSEGPAFESAARMADTDHSQQIWSLHEHELPGGARLRTRLAELPGRTFDAEFDGFFGIRQMKDGSPRAEMIYNEYEHTATSLDVVHRRLGTDLLQEVVRRDADRRTRGVPHESIVILDWGCGSGTALNELSERIKQAGIENVKLAGFSDISYRKWRSADPDVLFIWDAAEAIDQYIKPGRVDILFSHHGLNHIMFDNKQYLGRMADLLKADGVLITNTEASMTTAEARALLDRPEVTVELVASAETLGVFKLSAPSRARLIAAALEKWPSKPVRAEGETRIERVKKTASYLRAILDKFGEIEDPERKYSYQVGPQGGEPGFVGSVDFSQWVVGHFGRTKDSPDMREFDAFQVFLDIAADELAKRADGSMTQPNADLGEDWAHLHDTVNHLERTLDIYDRIVHKRYLEYRDRLESFDGSPDRPVPYQWLGVFVPYQVFEKNDPDDLKWKLFVKAVAELRSVWPDFAQDIKAIVEELVGVDERPAAARMAAPAEEAVIRSIFGDEPIRRDLAAMGVDDEWMATTPFYEPGEVSFGFGRRSLGQGFDHRPKVSPMTEQGRILKEDLGQLIRRRAAADNRRLFLVQVGLGDLANETSDLLELIAEAFRSAQTDPGGWSIDLALMDMDGAILQNARQKFGDSVGGIRMHYETVNVCDTDAMRAYSKKLNTIAPSGADYYLARNMLYENTTAGAMRNFDLPAPGYFDAWRGRVGGAEVYGFKQLISITLGLKNAMRFFGRPANGQETGTRYLIDPIEYFGSRPRVAFVPNGMRSVSPPMLGILELVDPQAVAALGLYSAQSGFKEVGESGARMADEKRSVLAPVGDLDGSVIDILRKKGSGHAVSDAEAQSLMRYVVADARKSILDRMKDRYADEDDLDAALSPTQTAGKCTVAQDRAVDIFKHVPSVRYAKHYTDNLLDADARHAFTIAGTEGGLAYWVDPTFNQFFDPILSGLWDVGRRFREKEKEMGTDFEARLIRDGFLPYDERLVELYAYAFAEDRALGEEADIARKIIRYGRIWEDSIHADRCIHRREFKGHDLTDPEKAILRAAAARILAAQAARSQGTEQLRLPVGLKRGFAVLGVQTLPLGIRLMVGDFVLAEWTSEHEIEAASRAIDPTSDAERQVDRIVTSTEAFENDLIGAARKVGERTRTFVTQWTRVQTAQLISSDPRSRSGEIKLLLSTLKYLTAQKPFSRDRYYLATQGLDPGEIKFMELFIKRTGMEGTLEIGEMPDAALQQNPSVVPVIWCGEEAGQKAGWVNVLFPKAGDGLQPYGKAKYVSTMAILGSVRNAASASLWDDYKVASSFDQEVFEAVHEQYGADAGFASASDYLNSIRNTNNRTLKLTQALPLYPFRVGARLSELQKTLQQIETMA